MARRNADVRLVSRTVVAAGSHRFGDEAVDVGLLGGEAGEGVDSDADDLFGRGVGQLAYRRDRREG